MIVIPKLVCLQFGGLVLLILIQLLFLLGIFEMEILFLSKVVVNTFIALYFANLIRIFAIFIFHFRLAYNKPNFYFEVIHFCVHDVFGFWILSTL